MLSNIKLISERLEKPLFSAVHILERLKLFNEAQLNHQASLKVKENQEIQVFIPGDEKPFNGLSWQIRPFDILKQMKGKKSSEIIAAKVKYLDSGENDYQLYDLSRPLEGNCEIEFLSFQDNDGKKVFWHSSAHVLGAILEQEYNGYLNAGPPIEDGFYYDICVGEGKKIEQAHFEILEKKINAFIQEGHQFERVLLSKAEALEIFKHNPFKLHIISNKIPDDGVISAYKCGSFIDLCKGPHLPSVSFLKAFKVLSVAQASWHGEENLKKEVDRVYGISFPSKAELNEFVEWQKKIASSDHRHIAIQQSLFFFHPASPAAGFFYPSGAKIYNKLIEMIRKQYWIRGYQEVISPCIYNKSMWDISGHSNSFNKNMFEIKVEDQDYSLKPMNCPAHCLIYGSKLHSYRDFPLRYADFGVLHRNEVSGSLQGLIRLRKFQQDDSHIFCRVDQVMDEVMEVLSFMKYVYDLFGLDYKVILATKPDNALGDEKLWEKAEQSLKEALEKFGKPFELAPGEGAFYGPKIEVHLRDIRKRYFQCGTIQLDFVLPERFDLKYRVSGEDESKSNFERPVMIHKAILGSIERFFALLIEGCQGKWPFWLSPKQIKVIPVNERAIDYAQKVYLRLKLEGYDVEFDGSRSHDKLGKKLRQAHLEHFNLVAIIGEKEVQNELVSLKDLHSQEDLGQMSIVKLLEFLKSKDIPVCEEEKMMKEKAFYGKEEKNSAEKLQELDEQLKFKVFFEDESREPGVKDREIYEEVRLCELDKEKLPNLFRWVHFMKKFAEM